MLKTPTDFAYDQLQDSVTKQSYKIEVNDLVQVRIFSNDGFKIINIENVSGNYARIDLDYLVEQDGRVKLPLVGKVALSGLTIAEAETFLQKIYNDFYVNPFVSVKVVNKRVIIFPGNGGKAQVINLQNNNTTVIETIALGGGIQEDGKAYKVKLIRNDGKNKPKVYLMDLSKIEGIAMGNTVVMANDIIYVEPRYRFAKTLIGEVTPLISLLTSTFLLYSLFIKK
ncbi:MAG: polysaccharide biosynthesis/export family protein [Bacteroidia bacterium]|jgi:polysaccharide export outer membrane protein|nr:polysaccharide biosynthesis/export family protein [Bacteroidia bacterium]